MPGMSGQMPRETAEKHPGLNHFTVTNVSVLLQVESQRASEGAIRVRRESWWAESNLQAWQESAFGNVGAAEIFNYTLNIFSQESRQLL